MSHVQPGTDFVIQVLLRKVSFGTALSCCFPWISLLGFDLPASTKSSRRYHSTPREVHVFMVQESRCKTWAVEERFRGKIRVPFWNWNGTTARMSKCDGMKVRADRLASLRHASRVHSRDTPLARPRICRPPCKKKKRPSQGTPNPVRHLVISSWLDFSHRRVRPGWSASCHDRVGGGGYIGSSRGDRARMDESHWKEAPFPIAAPDRLGTGSRFLRRLRGGSFDSWELNAERRNSKSAEFENVTPLLHLLLFPPPSSPSSSLLIFSSEPCMLLSRKGLMRCHRHRRLSPWIASLPRPPPIRRLGRARYARPTTSLPSSPAMTAVSGPCRWSNSPFELACVGSVTRWVFFPSRVVWRGHVSNAK